MRCFVLRFPYRWLINTTVASGLTEALHFVKPVSKVTTHCTSDLLVFFSNIIINITMNLNFLFSCYSLSAHHCYIILSFSLRLRLAVLFTVLSLFCVCVHVVLTQEPLCPPDAAADSPSCPHNDSNHPVSHCGTEDTAECGLAPSTWLSLNPGQDNIVRMLNSVLCFCFRLPTEK